MLNGAGDVIYVGKAKNLSKRVASYFSGKKDLKTQQLVANLADITVTITRNEEEAFLLELELIKQLQPKYNIIFKDAKSYPYIRITIADEFPELTFYRGNRQETSEYYGPYPSVRAAREGIELLQKIFRLRQCNNTFFKNRTRPCLQQQIERCSAPCVGLINKQDYMTDVANTKNFLQGKTNEVIDNLIAKMEAAAKELLYERAAQLREQIVILRKIQKHQVIIDASPTINVDILGVCCANNNACVHLLCIRGGRILGSKPYFPKQPTVMGENQVAAAEVLEAFILQHYINHNNDKQILDELIVSIDLPAAMVLGDTLSKWHGKTIKIKHYAKGDKSEWLKIAQNSAKAALFNQIEKTNNFQHLFLELGSCTGFNQAIKRIECFDVSHMQGDATIGACVVFAPTGALKEDYRRYNIKTVNAGDDYAALAEMLERHYIRLISLNSPLPELVLIDGGKGQLAIAEKVIKDKFNLLEVKLIGVAKGKARKLGCETLYLSSTGAQLELKEDSGALRLIQQIRDEAHRFAITGHRSKKARTMLHSSLEQIEGVGAKRRRELLKQFGGLKEVCRATAEELAKVPGISEKLAQRIYDALHKAADN